MHFKMLLYTYEEFCLGHNRVMQKLQSGNNLNMTAVKNLLLVLWFGLVWFGCKMYVCVVTVGDQVGLCPVRNASCFENSSSLINKQVCIAECEQRDPSSQQDVYYYVKICLMCEKRRIRGSCAFSILAKVIQLKLCAIYSRLI